MAAENFIITSPFLTKFTTEISEDGEHIFIDNFRFQVGDQVLSDSSQRAVLGSYIADLEREKFEVSMQDVSKNQKFLERAIEHSKVLSIFDEKEVLQELEGCSSSYRVLNGPEFFFDYYGYLIRLQSKDIFIGGCGQPSFAPPSVKIEIPKNSYDEHTKKILDALIVTFRKKHYEDFMVFNEIHKDLDFLSSSSIDGVSEKNINKIIEFFKQSNLMMDPSISNNQKEILKYSDLNELGWALSRFMKRKWLHTKAVKSGNPDFNALKKEIEIIKKKLTIN